MMELLRFFRPDRRYMRISASRPNGLDHLEETDYDNRCSDVRRDKKVGGSTFCVVALCVYSLLTTVLLFFFASLASVNNDNFSIPLGSDRNGFVPPLVGEPPKWTTFVHNSSNPYYVPEDVFADENRTREAVDKLIRTHSSAVRVNGHYSKWVHDDGSVSRLQATFTPPSMGEEQIYILRGFYQMRCIIVVLEAYGSGLHARKKGHHTAAAAAEAEGDKHGDGGNATVWHWPPEHVAYCINVLADAVQCMADATPLSFVNGFGSGHLTDGQQAWCRDWEALRAWADDSERAVSTAQGAAALEGPFGKLWRTVLP